MLNANYVYLSARSSGQLAVPVEERSSFQAMRSTFKKGGAERIPPKESLWPVASRRNARQVSLANPCPLQGHCSKCSPPKSLLATIFKRHTVSSRQALRADAILPAQMGKGPCEGRCLLQSWGIALQAHADPIPGAPGHSHPIAQKVNTDSSARWDKTSSCTFSFSRVYIFFERALNKRHV